MIGLHTHGHNQNEFREIRLTLAGNAAPEFEDGIGLPDPKGWEDATLPTFGGALLSVTIFSAVGCEDVYYKKIARHTPGDF